MQNRKWILYGANGYTGEIIARKAKEYNLTPILAGRNKEKIIKLSDELNLPYRIFSLDDPKEIQKNIQGSELVFNAAGPYTKTAKPIVEACIDSKIHYLDITGEIPVYELIKTYSAKAQKANVMLLPGVGFDVVPTDCVAKTLSEELPSADTLELVFYMESSASRGTTLSMIGQAPQGGKERINGEIVYSPLNSKHKKVQLGEEEFTAYSIPWGDVSTGFTSTKIPNITTYMVNSPIVAIATPLLSLAMQWRPLQTFVESVAGAILSGPNEKVRESYSGYIWGEVRDKKGNAKTMAIRTKEGYEFTAISSLLSVQEVFSGKILPGYQTPSLVFGKDFVFKIPGTEKIR